VKIDDDGSVSAIPCAKSCVSSNNGINQWLCSEDKNSARADSDVHQSASIDNDIESVAALPCTQAPGERAFPASVVLLTSANMDALLDRQPIRTGVLEHFVVRHPHTFDLYFKSPKPLMRHFIDTTTTRFEVCEMRVAAKTGIQLSLFVRIHGYIKAYWKGKGNDTRELRLTFDDCMTQVLFCNCSKVIFYTTSFSFATFRFDVQWWQYPEEKQQLGWILSFAQPFERIIPSSLLLRQPI
jgi:hypothetical protein